MFVKRKRAALLPLANEHTSTILVWVGGKHVGCREVFARVIRGVGSKTLGQLYRVQRFSGSPPKPLRPPAILPPPNPPPRPRICPWPTTLPVCSPPGGTPYHYPSLRVCCAVCAVRCSSAVQRFSGSAVQDEWESRLLMFFFFSSSLHTRAARVPGLSVRSGMMVERGSSWL